MRINNTNPEVERLIVAAVGKRVMLRLTGQVMLAMEGTLAPSGTDELYKLEATPDIYFSADAVTAVYPKGDPPSPDFWDSEHEVARKAAAADDWEPTSYVLAIIIRT
jgi:hypothetical protein